MSEWESYENEIEKSLRQAADDFLMQPADNTWKNIEQELHPQNNRRYFWWGAAAILLLTLGTYWLTSRQNYIAHTTSARLPANNKTGIINNNGEQNHNTTIPDHNNSQHALSKNNPAINNMHGENIIAKPLNEKYDVATNSSNMDKAALANDQRASISYLNNIPYTDLYNKQDILLASANIVQPVPDLTSSAANTVADRSNNPGKTISLKNKKSGLRPFFSFIFIPEIAYRNLFQTPAHSNSYYASAPVFYASLSQNYNVAASSLHQTPEAGFTVGVHVDVPVKNHFLLTSGLQLNKTDYKIAVIQTNAAASLRQTGTSQPLNAITYGAYAASYANAGDVSHVNNTYVSLELPFMIDYNLPLKNKLSVHFATGAGVDYLIYKQAYIYTSAYKRYFTNNSLIRNWNADFLFSSYLSIPAGNVYLQFGPEFRYQLISSYLHDNMIREFPYAAGLRLGIRWRP